MSQTSMSIKTFKTVAVRLPADTSILLRANHGVGKSQVVRQVGSLLRALLKLELPKLPVIDRRLSQMTEGDMVGLPSTDGNVTRFNPPDWYKKACDEPCVLFLDELNRATPEVMQAAFQVVLDRELNGWKLHPQTRVFAAINNSAAYTVNEMDPALLDRFYTIDLSPDAKEFCEWGRNTDPVQGGSLPPVIPDFIESSDKWLYPSKTAEPSSVEPSPRSWEKLGRALVHAGVIEDPTDEAFYHISIGFVGVEAAIAFRDFARSVDNRVSGEDVLEHYTDKSGTVKQKVKRMGQERQNGIIEKLAEHVIKTCDKLTDAQGTNVKAFMNDLPQELQISLWSKLTSQGIEKLELAKSIHKHCAETVLSVFGVPMGEAGIGIVPNIPGIFKDKQAAKK